MIDRIGHVKNPLTVIAMFAGLAEVSGAAVLPFVQDEVQLFYVKFLSAFPCLIVGLFFYTLWHYPKNLYAPSDYTDESNFVAALGTAIRLKEDEEVIAAADPLGADNVSPVAEPINGASVEVDQTVQEQATESTAQTSEERVVLTAPPISKTRTYVRKGAQYSAYSLTQQNKHLRLMNRIRRAEDLAINDIEAAGGLSFKRRVSPVSSPDIVFDGVSEQNDRVTVIEVKYSAGNRLILDSYRQAFFLALKCYDSLPASKQKNFLFIFALVTETELDPETADEFDESLNGLARSFPFQALITRYTYRHLEKATRTAS